MRTFFRVSVTILLHVHLKGRCSLGETCDVMMDKSKYFHEFVKFRVGNLIFLYNIMKFCKRIA